MKQLIAQIHFLAPIFDPGLVDALYPAVPGLPLAPLITDCPAPSKLT
jgi:hypothetical protein